MNRWKRFKSGFTKRKSPPCIADPAPATTHTVNHTKRATGVASNISTSSWSSRLITRKTVNNQRNTKNVVIDRKTLKRKTPVSNNSKQTTSNTSERTTRSGSRGVSQSVSKESQYSKKSTTGKRNHQDNKKQNKNVEIVIHTKLKRSNSIQVEQPTSVQFRKTPIIVRRSVEANEIAVVCDSTHEGRIVLQGKFNVDIDELFNMLFSSNSMFLKRFHEMRESRDLRMGEWITQNGERVRTVKVTVALQGNIGPKTSDVTEYQTLRKCSKPGRLYSIDVTSMNAGIPYADAFSVLIHFCITSKVQNSTEIVIYAKVKFEKSVWAVIKTFIERNAYAGLEEFFQSMQNELHKDFQRKQTTTTSSPKQKST